MTQYAVQPTGFALPSCSKQYHQPREVDCRRLEGLCKQLHHTWQCCVARIRSHHSVFLVDLYTMVRANFNCWHPHTHAQAHERLPPSRQGDLPHNHTLQHGLQRGVLLVAVLSVLNESS